MRLEDTAECTTVQFFSPPEWPYMASHVTSSPLCNSDIPELQSASEKALCSNTINVKLMEDAFSLISGIRRCLNRRLLMHEQMCAAFQVGDMHFMIVSACKGICTIWLRVHAKV